MRIGELAERTATTPRSLRYHEQRDLADEVIEQARALRVAD